MEERLEKLRDHAVSIIGLEHCLQSAVCIPLIKKPDGIHILYEVRSRKIDRQPGDICFPGGVLEEGESPVTAAIREMTEELLVKESQIEVLGPMDVFFNGRLVIYPFAVLLEDYEGTFAKEEVAEVFTVPVSFLEAAKPEEYMMDIPVPIQKNFPYERIENGENYRWRNRRERVLFYQYKSHTIWGITAAITESFINIF